MATSELTGHLAHKAPILKYFLRSIDKLPACSPADGANRRHGIGRVRVNQIGLAFSKPPKANLVTSSVNSSTNGSSAIILNGSRASSSRFRTKTLH